MRYRPVVLAASSMVGLLTFAGCGDGERGSAADGSTGGTPASCGAAAGGAADVGAWEPSTELPEVVIDASAVVVGDWAYVVGGQIQVHAMPTARVWRAELTGSPPRLGPWLETTSLPRAVSRAGAAVVSGRIYVIGGFGGYGPVADVVSALVGADGELGPWRSEPELTTRRMDFGAAVSGERIYVVGGNTTGGASAREVEAAAVGADGVLGTWETLGMLTAKNHAVVAHGSRLYAIGGERDEIVTSSCVEEDGRITAWREPTPMPPCASVTNPTAELEPGRTDLSAVVHDGWLYFTGGFSRQLDGGRSAHACTFRAELRSDGALGDWVEMAPMSTPRFAHAMVGTDRMLLVVGGDTLRDDIRAGLTAVEVAELR